MSYSSYVRWREKNPERYSYSNLRNRAKQRGKPFAITFDYFLQFCRKYDYIQNKGKTATSYSVDCIDPNLGYVPGNIRVLSLSENSRKGTKILRYDWETKKAHVEYISREKVDDNWMDEENNEEW